MDSDAGGNEVSLQLNHIHESKQIQHQTDLLVSSFNCYSQNEFWHSICKKKIPLTSLMAEANNMIIPSSDTASYSISVKEEMKTSYHQSRITFQSVPIRLQKYDVRTQSEMTNLVLKQKNIKKIHTASSTLYSFVFL